jgi:hypothetical protein
MLEQAEGADEHLVHFGVAPSPPANVCELYHWWNLGQPLLPPTSNVIGRFARGIEMVLARSG